MNYFPFMIRTEGCKMLVVGGGPVATRKLKTLLQSELSFTVLAKEFSEELYRLQEKYPERIKLILEEIDEDFPFLGYDFVLLATGEEYLQKGLSRRALDRNIPVLTCDHLGDSSFYLPKIIEHIPLVLGLSTGGQNPTLSRIIGGEITEFLEKYDPKKIEILNLIRDALVRKKNPRVKEIIEELWYAEAITVENYWEDLHENKNRNTDE